MEQTAEQLASEQQKAENLKMVKTFFAIVLAIVVGLWISQKIS